MNTVSTLVKAVCDTRRDVVVIPFTEYMGASLADVLRERAVPRVPKGTADLLARCFRLTDTLRRIALSPRDALDEAHPLLLSLVAEVRREEPYSADDLMVKVIITQSEAWTQVRLALIAAVGFPEGRLRNLGVVTVDKFFRNGATLTWPDSRNLMTDGAGWVSFSDMPSLLRLIYD